MTNWAHTLDLRYIWKDETITPKEKGKELAKRIRDTFPNEWFNSNHPEYCEELDDITETFDCITGYGDVSPVNELYYTMSDFYAFCNSTYYEWPVPVKMCFVSW